jgi:hypothetical protein
LGIDRWVRILACELWLCLSLDYHFSNVLLALGISFGSSLHGKLNVLNLWLFFSGRKQVPEVPDSVARGNVDKIIADVKQRGIFKPRKPEGKDDGH